MSRRAELIEAVERCRVAGQPVALAKALRELGEMERRQDRVSARQHYEDAVATYRGTGEILGLAHTVRHLGDVYYSEGHSDLAEPCFLEALGLYRNCSQTPPLDLANAIRSLAVLKSECGEVNGARALWEEARSLYESVGVTPGVDESSRRLASLDRQ